MTERGPCEICGQLTTETINDWFWCCGVHKSMYRAVNTLKERAQSCEFKERQELSHGAPVTVERVK